MTPSRSSGAVLSRALPCQLPGNADVANGEHFRIRILAKAPLERPPDYPKLGGLTRPFSKRGCNTCRPHLPLLRRLTKSRCTYSAFVLNVNKGGSFPN